ncbi:polyprenyl synthetase family protein [Candidatus Fermentibacteria bacterium]|nr:polyprenyl synthetase family protein [Candidatus Fermentibacteria bacterium]
MRPSLIVLSAYSGSESPAIAGDSLLAIATAVEMVHTYSLIHDDLPCMDDDLMRRGIPTCHVAYGISDATWAGSALLIEAFVILAREFSASGCLPEAARVMGDAAGLEGMVGGQWLDTQLPGTGVSGDAFIEVHRRKTAALLQGCCTLGGLAGGVDEPAIVALRSFGECLGLAFQAIDDLLDVTGNERVVGKRVGKDAQAGKLTATATLGVEGARRYVDELIDLAMSALASLEGPAVPRLRDLAFHLGHRVL